VLEWLEAQNRNMNSTTRQAQAECPECRMVYARPDIIEVTRPIAAEENHEDDADADAGGSSGGGDAMDVDAGVGVGAGCLGLGAMVLRTARVTLTPVPIKYTKESLSEYSASAHLDVGATGDAAVSSISPLFLAHYNAAVHEPSTKTAFVQEEVRRRLARDVTTKFVVLTESVQTLNQLQHELETYYDVKYEATAQRTFKGRKDAQGAQIRNSARADAEAFRSSGVPREGQRVQLVQEGAKFIVTYVIIHEEYGIAGSNIKKRDMPPGVTTNGSDNRFDLREDVDVQPPSRRTGNHVGWYFPGVITRCHTKAEVPRSYVAFVR
jgi:hypothetical protein